MRVQVALAAVLLATACGPAGAPPAAKPAAAAASPTALPAPTPSPSPAATSAATPSPTQPTAPASFVDAHNHWPVGLSASQIVAVLDRHNVRKVVLMQNGENHQPPLAAADAYPDRIVPFAGFASQKHTRAEVESVERQLATGRYRGMGEFLSLHYAFTSEGGTSAPRVEVAADSPWVVDLLCLAAKYGIVLTIHMESTADTLAALGRALRRQPNAIVIWAHQTPLKTFGGQAAADARKGNPEQLASLLAENPNLRADIAPGYEGFFFDTSIDMRLPEAWRSVYERFSDRFVVGFDQPFAQGWQNPGGYARRVGWVRGWLSQLGPTTQARLAAENAERLLAQRPPSGQTCQFQSR